MNIAMAPESESKSKPKHRKSTCAGCRRRKSKCDGKTPKCTTCIAYKDECHYDKPPSLAYVRSLEDEVSDLKAQLRHVRSQAWSGKSGQDEERKASVTSPGSDGSHQSGSANSLAHRNRHVKWETDISIDDHGGVTFHNSTSAVHEPPANSALTPVSQPGGMGDYVSPQDDQRIKRDLVMNATHQRQIEPFAIANSAMKINVPKEISSELLKYHWCWMHPLFLFVYRPAFTRGMAMIDNTSLHSRDPPYFSDTLLKVIHAHGARFLNHEVYQHNYPSSTNVQTPLATAMTGQEFMEQITEDARYGLGMDMLRPSSIPTIQALLQQSAREIVFGRSSQAWTFAGVAFRMALDMGIHLPSDNLQSFVKSLTPEDIEIRKRLFWSCYTWDKILSLYLGRMPGFTHPATDDIPLTFMDDYSDSDLWAPYYGETPKPDHAHAPNYPPCPGYVVSCFRQLSRLCVILNDLLQHIYSGEAAARRDDEDNSAEAKAANEEPFIRISRILREWLVSLPPHLCVNPDKMPPLAPPVHIMSLNLLYHTTVILLHRPVILGARDMNLHGPYRSYQTCLSATAAIHDLLMLQSDTFGLSHVSYLNAYSAYIAATIAVLRFEREYRPNDDPSTTAKRTGLDFLLEVLSRTAAAMPALERSHAIIGKRMKAVLDRHQHANQNTYPDPSTSMATTLSLPTSAELTLAQPTPFQTLSTSSMHPPNHSHAQHEYNTATTSSDPNSSFVAPMQWQSSLRTSLYSEPNPPHNALFEDFLPAFPGQQFPISGVGGSEHSFGSNEAQAMDQHSRTALLGYNLDPHPRLNMSGIMEGIASGDGGGFWGEGLEGGGYEVGGGMSMG